MEYVSLTYRNLSYVLACTTFILILLGGYVKAINAGLACPDWPKCYGSWVPDLSDKLVFAEWFHRLWAMLNGFFMIGMTVLAYRIRKVNPSFFMLSLIGTFLYAVQVLLGGLTVLGTLEPVVVVMHLGNAILIVVLQLIIAFLATIQTEGFVSRSITLAKS